MEEYFKYKYLQEVKKNSEDYYNEENRRKEYL
jgi:hypothetical protein